MSDALEMFDQIIDVQPPLDDQKLLGIPAKRGVALLLGEHGQPIVLLTAADIRARIRNRLSEPPDDVRKKTADLRQITRRIAWKLAFSHFETDLRFLEIAQKLRPRDFAAQLAFKPAWFVRVDINEAFPHFQRSRDLAAGGRMIGPFPSGRAADKFIDSLHDSFDLCRDYQCLRKSPHGPRCAYAQMNRCLSPCDGTISMDQYRLAIAAAADYAAGRRGNHDQRLRDDMAAAAKSLEFERAASIKTRLDRLGEFDKPEYAHVAPLEAFAFILVQAGQNPRQARVFLVDRGKVVEPPPLDYPLQQAQLAAVLSAQAEMARNAIDMGADETWRIALVSHYLFAGPQQQGLILRRGHDMTADELAAAIEEAGDALHLKAPQPRRKGQRKQESPSDQPPANGYNEPSKGEPS